MDWVYAEELDVRSNYFWSPNGKQIVYLQMDEQPVPTYPITDYIPTHPTVDQEKYPKAGDANPQVQLGVVSADGGRAKCVNLPNTDDAYIPRFGWVRDGLMYALRSEPRAEQAGALLHRAEYRTFATRTDGDQRRLGRDQRPLQVSSKTGSACCGRVGAMATRISISTIVDQSNAMAPLKLERQLTKGEWDVLAIDAVDEKKGWSTSARRRKTSGSGNCIP